MKYCLMLLFAASLSFLPAHAQVAESTVPDLVRLNLPQAAAALNGAGLLLGEQLSVLWTEESGQQQNSVSAQSIEPGLSVAPGTSVSVIVLRQANMRLIYDDNDLSLLNMSETTADLSRLHFSDVNNVTFFNAARLANTLIARQCVQVWSIARAGAKNINDCESIQRWLSTGNQTEHFWTTLNGVQEFVVLEDGIERGRCPTAPQGSEANPLRCEFYYSAAGSSNDLSDYVYFVYTPEAFAVINVTEDRWMPTLISMYNYNPSLTIPGLLLTLGGEDVFNEEHRRGLGSIQQLAPGQCLAITSTSNNADAPPQPCHVVAQRVLTPDVAFWLADFEVESRTIGRRMSCPAAVAERPTACILPR